MPPPSYSATVGDQAVAISGKKDQHTYGDLNYAPVYTFAQPYQGTYQGPPPPMYPPPAEGQYPPPAQPYPPPPAEAQQDPSGLPHSYMGPIGDGSGDPSAPPKDE